MAFYLMIMALKAAAFMSPQHQFAGRRMISDDGIKAAVGT